MMGPSLLLALAADRAFVPPPPADPLGALQPTIEELLTPGRPRRAGAAYAQVRAGTSSWSFAPTDFDDPADREQIDRGIHDAENGC